MTQTQTRLFPAEVHVRTMADGQVQLKAFDDGLRPEGQMLLSPAQAQMLMRDLAAALGFRVIAEDTAVELTKYVGSLIASVDGKREEAFKEGSLGAAQGALFAGTDALRDLRDLLAREDVTNR